MTASKLRIVFLDAGSLDYGDLSFRPFSRFGSLKVFPQTRPSQMVRRLRGVQVAITNKAGFDRCTLSRLPDLRCIHVTATGVNNVDLEAAKERGIAVTHVSGYSTESVVEFTLAFILMLAGNIRLYDTAVRKGRWSRSPYFTLPLYPVREVAGKTLGIVGYGTIGRRVAAVARVLGMKVEVAKIPGRRYGQNKTPKRLPLDSLIRRADFLTIHAPLSPLTQDLIDGRRLGMMKKSAFVINMARGGIVNEKALAQALRKNRLAGAATDVTSIEPPPAGHVLLGAPRLIMTPHIAWASLEARRRLVDEVALNMKAFRAGKKRNRVV